MSRGSPLLLPDITRMEHHSVVTKVIELYCAKCWAFFLQIILNLEYPATKNENRESRINVVEPVVAGFVKVGDVIRGCDHDTCFPDIGL